VLDNPDTAPNRALIVELVAAARLPAIYGLFELVEVGGLTAYSFDLADLSNARRRTSTPSSAAPILQSRQFRLVTERHATQPPV
jgi:hypothetical protein